MDCALFCTLYFAEFCLHVLLRAATLHTQVTLLIAYMYIAQKVFSFVVVWSGTDCQILLPTLLLLSTQSAEK